MTINKSVNRKIFNLGEENTYSDIAALESVSFASNYNNYIFKLISKHIQGDEVLDFGAGYGNFCSYLKNNNKNVTAIEVNEEAINRLNELSITNYKKIEKTGKKFQNIVSLNVLEHIHDDKKVFNELVNSLKLGGKIILYLPASMLIWTKLDELVQHRRRYSKKLILDLVNTDKVEIQHIHWVDFVGWATLLISKVIRLNLKFNKDSIIFYDKFLFKPLKYLDLLFKYIIGKNILVVILKIKD